MRRTVFFLLSVVAFAVPLFAQATVEEVQRTREQYPWLSQSQIQQIPVAQPQPQMPTPVGACMQYNFKVQQYAQARQAYSQSRSGWDRAWKTSVPAAVGALIARSATNDWAHLALVGGVVGVGSMAVQEGVAYQSRKNLKTLEQELMAAQYACAMEQQLQRQEAEFRIRLMNYQGQSVSVSNDRRPVREEGDQPVQPVRRMTSFFNSFDNADVIVKIDGREYILPPGDSIEKVVPSGVVPWGQVQMLGQHDEPYHLNLRLGRGMRRVSGGYEFYDYLATGGGN